MMCVLALLAPTLMGPNIVTFSVDGTARQAVVCVPTKASKHPPLVIGFHGHGGTMQGTSTLFDVQGKWPEAVVVYPQGLKTPSTHDPQGHTWGWQSVPGSEGDRDIKLFDVICAKMEQQYHCDPKRVYAMGFSNGAKFTLALWSARHDRLAAIAKAAGIIEDVDKPLKPLPAFCIAGRADTTAPFAEQVETNRYIRKVDGAINASPMVINGVRHFHGTKEDVAIYIHPGGHMYPSSITGPVVNFFKHHKQP